MKLQRINAPKNKSKFKVKKSYPTKVSSQYAVGILNATDWHSSPFLYQQAHWLLLLSSSIYPSFYEDHPVWNKCMIKINLSRIYRRVDLKKSWKVLFLYKTKKMFHLSEICSFPFFTFSPVGCWTPTWGIPPFTYGQTKKKKKSPPFLFTRVRYRDKKLVFIPCFVKIQYFLLEE